MLGVPQSRVAKSINCLGKLGSGAQRIYARTSLD
jgi:hypothetical protein